jgi:hypothetical protein
MKLYTKARGSLTEWAQFTLLCGFVSLKNYVLLFRTPSHLRISLPRRPESAFNSSIKPDFYGEKLLVCPPNPRLEALLTAVRQDLFNTLATNFQICRLSHPSASRGHAVPCRGDKGHT